MRAYLDGLKMLARRELSEAQVRQRLIRRAHEPDDIESAIARLKEERAIDDARTAAAIARTESGLKHRGKFRVKRKIESAGIAPATARGAVDEVFGGVDDEEQIAAALGRRLRAGAAIENDREFGRLYRYLIGQGYEADRVMKFLDARRRRRE
jgi:regulatory protein